MRLLLFMLCAILAGPMQAQDALRLGVFGVVEGVDPLVVAGRQVDMPDGVRVISPLGPGYVIAEGDTLAVVAAFEEGRLMATRVLEFFPVVGPLAGVKDGMATVMGTVVTIPPEMSVKSGQWVALSGFWNGGEVVTTKLRRVDSNGFGQLAGVMEPPAGPEPLRMGGSLIIGAETPQDGFGGEIWMFSGQPERDGLRMRLTAKGVFGGKVDLVLWQGYASLPIASQTYMIQGAGIIGTATDALMPAAGSLVTRCAAQGRVINAAPEGLEAAFVALGCAMRIPVD